jgi:cysteine sulfinate desulfinase/cysteine desulfurase-like protein
MGVSPEEARECLRFSFGWPNVAEDGTKAAELVVEALRDLR